MRKLIVALAAVLALGSGCSSGSKVQGPGDGMTPSQTEAEYRSEAQHLSLAPGWSWPQDIKLDKTGPDGKAMFYQRGYGKTQANWYWYCSWGRTYLAATGQPRQDAFQEMAKIKDMFYYKVALLPQDRSTFDKTMSRAGLGDTADLANDIQLNCPPAQ